MGGQRVGRNLIAAVAGAASWTCPMASGGLEREAEAWPTFILSKMNLTDRAVLAIELLASDAGRDELFEDEDDIDAAGELG